MTNDTFTGLREKLEEMGFEPSRFPWKMTSTHYDITQVEEGEVCGPIFAITCSNYGGLVFRGRIPNTGVLEKVFLLVMECYLLTEDEILKIQTL
jgi:hypothetical protein